MGRSKRILAIGIVGADGNDGQAVFEIRDEDEDSDLVGYTRTQHATSLTRRGYVRVESRDCEATSHSQTKVNLSFAKADIELDVTLYCEVWTNNE